MQKFPVIRTLCACAAGLLVAGALSAQEIPASPRMQRALDSVARELRLDRLVADGKISVALIDVTDRDNPRYAGLNDREMIYAASLPKIAVLLAGFEKVERGELPYTAELRQTFTDMIRRSSNQAASAAIQAVGFGFIRDTLTDPRYRLYDPDENGGLWVGKAYGGPNDRWRRDPLHNLSHGANAYQAARFFYLLDRGELVSEAAGARMKEILSKPAIQHKFVKGLANTPGRRIYRKSGTWRNWHADAALIEAGDKRYVAAALVESPRGGDILVRLIGKLDTIVCGEQPVRVARALEPTEGSE